MSNLRRELAKAKIKFATEVKEAIEDVAKIMGESLVEESKVDTGLFAANWKVSLDVARKDDSTHRDYDILESDVGPRGTNIRMISEDEAKRVATDIPEFKLGQEIIFSNSVPYVDEIDGFTDAVKGSDKGEAEANRRYNK